MFEVFLENLNFKWICLNNSRPTFSLWRISGHTVKNVDQNQEEGDE